MNKQTEMNEEIYKYIADFIECTIEQLKSDDTYFVKSRKKDYIKIRGYMPFWTDSYGVR